MPTYDYSCSACGKTFEIFHSIKEPARTICPHCHQPKLQRKIGEGAGLIFKGRGFYETDYKHSAKCDQCSKKGDATMCPHKD